MLERRADGLRLAGLQAYHGGAQHLRSADEREAAIGFTVASVRAARAALAAAGMEGVRVTGAGTGSFAFEAASGEFDELQPGSYAFLDAEYAAIEPAPVTRTPSMPAAARAARAARTEATVKPIAASRSSAERRCWAPPW